MQKVLQEIERWKREFDYEVEKLGKDLKELTEIVDGLDSRMKKEYEEIAAHIEKLEKNLRRLSASMNTGDTIHLGNNGVGQGSVDRLEGALAKLRSDFE
jgi:chromosome segregation ATPase